MRSSSLSVIVPTYRRTMELRRCLVGLERQLVKPLEVLVVARNTDTQTLELLDGYGRTTALPLRVLIVDRPGVVAALNLALDSARGDFVAMTDDDAVPHPDWVERLEAAFAAFPDAGGIGGRDVLTLPDNPPPAPLTEKVGITTWYGRSYGNFHCGKGAPREVRLLKGVNMAYRRVAIGALRFDERLLGSGAQVANEALFSGAIRLAGWQLIYDPAIEVDHIVGERPPDQERNRMDGNVLREMMHNSTLGLLEHDRPWTIFSSLAYSALVGSWNAPGVASALRLIYQRRPGAWIGFRNNLLGIIDGCRTWRRTKAENNPARTAVRRR
jgi:glycosyltransferase involved in cell wall biosynthesis